MPNYNKRTLWLLGAGFSRPLGGPTFADLISIRTERWVRAWVANFGKGALFEPRTSRLIYEKGVRVGLWQDAEACILLLDEARSGGMAAAVVQTGMQEVENNVASPVRGVDPVEIETAFTEITQFVAIATAHYVPDIKTQLPESWEPYRDWAKRLRESDTVLTFNYDRVVERLRSEVGKRCELLKLHGSTPTNDDLAQHLKEKTRVDAIYVPGPSKVTASQHHVWAAATDHLAQAARLVVIGYSFPPSDALARKLVLGNFKGERVAIVLGQNDNRAGDRAAAMFRHIGTEQDRRVVNTRMYAQTYFTDGTARAPADRFMHEEFWVDDSEQTPQERDALDATLSGEDV